ncbi:MAG TPA: SHOCT domain-containing protein [Allosphingosinicella sp.]|nr:SHOCT domain-containing protein [Allosphingosinicella sp.]
MGGNRRTLGLVVGLGGAALTGYALFTLLSSAGCAGSGAESCPPLPGFPVWLVLGILLVMAGMFMGGGVLLTSALFAAIGGGALAVGALGRMPGMPTFPWLFGGLFLVFGLLPLLLGVVLRRAGAAKQAMAGELMRTGAKGIGTIVEVTDTGVTINENPRIVIRMRIEPLDGSAAVERSKTVTVSRVAVPRAGERYPAWFDRADPDKWMFGTDMDESAPAEVKEMFARARAGPGDEDRTESGPVEELSRLTELWKDGALTDSEFADAKARLLPRIGR